MATVKEVVSNGTEKSGQSVLNPLLEILLKDTMNFTNQKIMKNMTRVLYSQQFFFFDNFTTPAKQLLAFSQLTAHNNFFIAHIS
jgi:hypothetical protein